MTRERFHPVSMRVFALVAAGLVTAVPPWWIVGSLASAVAHGVFGAALIALGVWGTWRPLVEVEGGVLRYRPRLAPRRAFALALDEVQGLLPTPRTGHAPSERDLAAWLGIRLRSGEVRWLDLAELPGAARRRVRGLVEAAARGAAPRGAPAR